jgi:hypothetical protein
MLGASVALAQAVPEVEPNGTPATANPIVGPAPAGLRSGAISPIGDLDVFSVAARKGDFLFVYANGDPETDGTGTDLRLTLLGPDGTTVLIIADESHPTIDPGPFPTESFLISIPATGTYFVRVAHASPATGTGTYTLRAEILKESVLVTGAGAGGGPHVRTYEGADGGPRLSFLAYVPAFAGGVHVATCDLDGDGYPDVITGAGAGGGPHVRAFNGVTGDPLPGPAGSFFAYSPAFSGGVYVACGDVNGDGVPEIITGAGPGGGPHVRVLAGDTLASILEFFAYNPGFAGGVAVAASDVNGDGNADIITGAGPGGGPHVRVLAGATLAPIHEFFAYSPGFAGGVAVAAGDVNGDGSADVITGAGPGGGPHVEVFDGQTGALVYSFFAYTPLFPGGVSAGGR